MAACERHPECPHEALTARARRCPLEPPEGSLPSLPSMERKKASRSLRALHVQAPSPDRALPPSRRSEGLLRSACLRPASPRGWAPSKDASQRRKPFAGHPMPCRGSRHLPSTRIARHTVVLALMGSTCASARTSDVPRLRSGELPSRWVALRIQPRSRRRARQDRGAARTDLQGRRAPNPVLARKRARRSDQRVHF